MFIFFDTWNFLLGALPFLSLTRSLHIATRVLPTNLALALFLYVYRIRLHGIWYMNFQE